MRYLATVELVDGTFIHSISEFSQTICSWWKGERSFNFSSATNMRSRWVFSSPFNLDICTVNCTTETQGIKWEKAALNPLVSRWSVSSELSFVEERPDFHMPLQHTNGQTLTTLKQKIWVYSQLLSSPIT